MEIGYLPKEHLFKLLDEQIPSMRYDGKSDLAAWQKEAREKLADLIGINEIAKYRVEPEIEIEYDKICEDMGSREIRFRYKTEENVTVPCHLVIPNGADKPLPVVITLQGHSRGMHISLGRPIFPGDEETCKGGDRDFVVRAVNEGICAIAMEQRCFGENGGNKDKNNIPDCTEPSLRAILLGRTIVGERVWDIMRLIDVLEKNFTDIVDINKVMCLGNSGGGTATTYASALDERIKISVPSCAVCRYSQSIAARPHCACNYVPYIAKYFDMGDLCSMVAPRNLVIVSGLKDTDFPVESAIACSNIAKTAYNVANVPENLVHVIGPEGHRFYADLAWPHIRKALKALD